MENSNILTPKLSSKYFVLKTSALKGMALSNEVYYSLVECVIRYSMCSKSKII